MEWMAHPFPSIFTRSGKKSVKSVPVPLLSGMKTLPANKMWSWFLTNGNELVIVVDKKIDDYSII